MKPEMSSAPQSPAPTHTPAVKVPDHLRAAWDSLSDEWQKQPLRGWSAYDDLCTLRLAERRPHHYGGYVDYVEYRRAPHTPAVKVPDLPQAAEKVIARAIHYHDQWSDKDEAYWFFRLSQEVGELGSTLANDHPDTPEHELEQIASIALNWLARRCAPQP